MARIASLFLAVFLAVPAAAQTWTGGAQDSGVLVSAWTSAPEASLSMFCNTPSRAGVHPFATEEHEVQRTDPFQFVLRFSEALAGTQYGMRLDQVTMTIDGTAYRLPPVMYDELWGDWSLGLRMDDPILAAMGRAGSLLLDPGQGTAYSYPTDGLAGNVQRMLSVCVTSWAQLGQPVPATLAGFQGGPGTVPAIAPEFRMRASLYASCEGPFRLDPDAVTETDLDQDGTADVTVFYGGVECLSGIHGQGAGLCGASQCLTSTFLSSRQGESDFDLYAQNVVIDPARPAQLGLVARYRVCEDLRLQPDCIAWYVWRGGQMQRIN